MVYLTGDLGEFLFIKEVEDIKAGQILARAEIAALRYSGADSFSSEDLEQVFQNEELSSQFRWFAPDPKKLERRQRSKEHSYHHHDYWMKKMMRGMIL